MKTLWPLDKTASYSARKYWILKRVHVTIPKAKIPTCHMIELPKCRPLHNDEVTLDRLSQSRISKSRITYWKWLRLVGHKATLGCQVTKLAKGLFYATFSWADSWATHTHTHTLCSLLTLKVWTCYMDCPGLTLREKKYTFEIFRDFFPHCGHSIKWTSILWWIDHLTVQSCGI